MTLIYFILVLGITIMIHEFGHFIFAKKAGIYVYEFSLGMGPRLFHFRRKNDETEYSIRLFPIGGYVQMAGEQVEEDQNIPKEKQMQNKTWWQRCLTIVAGVVFNFLLAIILLFVVGLVNGAPQRKPLIAEVPNDMPADIAGLEVGDQILKVNGKKTTSVDRFLLEMQLHLGKPLRFEVRRQNGSTETIEITPKELTDGEKKSYQYGFSLNNQVSRGVWPAIQYAFTKTGSLIEQMVLVIGNLCTGKLGLGSLAGPVGIYNIVGESARAGFINIIYLIAYLSINVGFINLLPIPAFDGGRLLFLIIEKIKGSPISPKVENIIHSVGFVLLMALMVIITYNDIIRLL